MTSTVLRRAKNLLAPLSPGRRRWKQFLRALPLNPAELPDPLPAPSPQDFIICGTPRTGTTLLTAMLYQPPRVVTVMEPWDGMRLPPDRLFASIREEISATGRLARGKLDTEALLEDGAVRWGKEGESRPRLGDLADGYLLGVKWPAFYRYLGRLPQTKFLVCVRDPLETISSFKKNGGRMGQGLQYETQFNRELNEHLQSATDDVRVRRLFLYDYITSRIVPFLEDDNVFVVRYERWFADAEALLEDISDFLSVPLGPSHASVRDSKSDLILSDAEVEMIREHCCTAEALGYALGGRGQSSP